MPGPKRNVTVCDLSHGKVSSVEGHLKDTVTVTVGNQDCSTAPCQTGHTCIYKQDIHVQSPAG